MIEYKDKDTNDHWPFERRLLPVYYELDEQRKSIEGKDIAICRVEQLCPFPYDLIQRELKRYPNAEVVWCQEEPMNMGPYSYIAPRLATAMKALDRGIIDDVKYVGRAPAAATAVGFYSMHTREQSELVQTPCSKNLSPILHFVRALILGVHLCRVLVHRLFDFIIQKLFAYRKTLRA